MWSTSTAGALLIAVSYSMAARDGAGQDHYAVFWLGMLIFYVPALLVTTARTVSEPMRHAWVLGYGLFTYLPKLLRDPGKPLFHDEIAHWRQAADLAIDGRLFQPNHLVSIISRFPGLHILTAELSSSTGLTAWQSAVVLMATAHVLTLFAAFQLGKAVFRSARAGAVAALVYSLNPSFLYFDTEFAYESLSMPLFLWCLACLAKLHRAHSSRERIGWAAGAALTGLGAVATHHLTSVIIAFLLTLLAALTALAAARGEVPKAVAAATTAVMLVVAGCAAAWLGWVAPKTFSYLSPYLGGGSNQLLHYFSDLAGRRSLFHGSTDPAYEWASAFAVPLLCLGLTLTALIRWRRNPHKSWRDEPLLFSLCLFGLLYFPSLPFILVQFGAEGARRTWGFTWVGLALLTAPVILAGADRIRAMTGRARALTAVASLVVACDALVGNVTAGLDPEYRFPGPYVFGSDTRSGTPELVATSHWFEDREGARHHVVSDRYTGLSLVRDADARPAAPAKSFPAYDLYVDSSPPSDHLVHQLSSSAYTYLIIDKRMATQLPRDGIYFAPGEPFPHGAPSPISPQNLDRYNNLPWTTKVYESDNYAIYRFDFRAFNAYVKAAR
ncbi:hypothetical protein ACFV2N_46380 [Streptomyces sp. NPDC059680]|uniref:hypothetical protein n=1 Tax=Streptomyces sp. NPDC059680 TaxID=3346904 RepID=UPI0036781851